MDNANLGALGVPAVNALSPRYTYKPLDSDQDEIRVIEIAPQHQMAVAHDHLLSFSIKHQPRTKSQYAALSYTWGDPKITRPILLNGKRFHVTRNLWEALNQISKPGYQSEVWIDAICINQEDIREKERQVEKIKEIYLGAKFVIAWLGPPEGKGDFVLKKLESAGKRILLDTDGDPNSSILGADLDISMSAADDSATFPLHLLDNIFGRPYWQRVWVAQELAYAQEACLMFGGAVTNWHLFKVVCKYLLDCRFSSQIPAACGKYSSSLPL